MGQHNGSEHATALDVHQRDKRTTDATLTSEKDEPTAAVQVAPTGRSPKKTPMTLGIDGRRLNERMTPTGLEPVLQA